MALLRADRLREMRERRGLTQRELARLCGIGENQVNKYENSVGEPSVANLHAIARALDTTTDYLLGLNDLPNIYSNADLEPDERKLLEAYTIGDSTAVVALLYERLEKLSKLPAKE